MTNDDPERFLFTQMPQRPTVGGAARSHPLSVSGLNPSRPCARPLHVCAPTAGLEFRVKGLGFGVYGFGFRVSGFSAEGFGVLCYLGGAKNRISIIRKRHTYVKD